MVNGNSPSSWFTWGQKPWNNLFFSYPTHIPLQNFLSSSFKIYLQRYHLIIFTTTTLSHHHCQPKLFLLVLVAQWCLNLWDPVNFAIPPGSSAHGILQARILEWVAISFSRRFSRPRNRTWVSCIAVINKPKKRKGGGYFQRGGTSQRRKYLTWNEQP